MLASRRLQSFPHSGRTIPDAENNSLREIIVQGYRLMYRIEAERVLILAVMHGSRDFSNPNNQPWSQTDNSAE